MLITTDKGFTEHRDEQHYGIPISRVQEFDDIGFFFAAAPDYVRILGE